MSAEEHGSGAAHKVKEKIAHPFPHLRQKLKETHLYDAKVKAVHVKHQVGKFGNLFNPAHRHDEEHEKKTDAKRLNICEQHRFNSFAPERDGNLIKWYVDGRDYFWAVSVALEEAKETIYIADWWLSPELVKRPTSCCFHQINCWYSSLGGRPISIKSGDWTRS
jgi:phospholipase D1/2